MFIFDTVERSRVKTVIYLPHFFSFVIKGKYFSVEICMISSYSGRSTQKCSEFQASTQITLIESLWDYSHSAVQFPVKASTCMLFLFLAFQCINL